MSRVLQLLFSQNIWAQVPIPDYTGVWTGSSTVHDDMCTGGQPLESWTEATTLTIRDQSGTLFTADLFSLDPSDGVSFSATAPGSITPPSTVNPMFFSGMLSDGAYMDVWTDPVVVTGNTMTVTFTFMESFGPDYCSGSGTATLTRVAIDPAASTPSEILNNPATLDQIVTILTNTLGARIQSALSGFMKGFRGLGKAHGMYETQIGLASGDGMDLTMLGVWGSYSYTDFENDFYRTKYDGDRHMFMGGSISVRQRTRY